VSNLALWEKLGKTDPDQTKAFQRGGGFRGTAIKPIYTEQKMTEEFGPCGVGWGIHEPTFQVVPGSEGQVAVYCTVGIWIKQNELVSAPIYGVGGDLVVVSQKGGLRTDDEAFKKAFTDAVGNAMKHLGMSADVHMGRFDDNKYVASVRAELHDETPARPANGHEVLKQQLVASTAGPPPAPALDANGKPFKHGMRIEPEMRDLWTALKNELDAAPSLALLRLKWYSPQFKEDYDRIKPDWQDDLTKHCNALIALWNERSGGKQAPRTLGDRLDEMEQEGAGGPQ
jgi:hypothetical protein